VCADIHRLGRLLAQHGHHPGAHPSTGLQFAVIDATLAAPRLMDVAEAVGLDIVCIGGILNDAEELVETSGTPVGRVAVLWPCLGHPGEAPVERPRIALESVPHTDRYRAQTPGEMEADLTRTGAGTQSGGWLALLSCYFASGESVEEREAPLRRTLDRQGPTRWRQSAAPRSLGPEEHREGIEVATRPGWSEWPPGHGRRIPLPVSGARYTAA